MQLRTFCGEYHVVGKFAEVTVIKFLGKVRMEVRLCAIACKCARVGQ